MDNETQSPWPKAEMELVLRKPVTAGGETITSLVLREPTCAEWEKTLEQPSVKQRGFIVSIVSGIPTTTVALMGIGDVTRAEEYLMRFFEVGQKIDA